MSAPKDAAAVILLRNPDDPMVYWVRRAEHLQYLGGFHAYPGGQRDSADASIEIDHCPDDTSRTMRVCAIRELFEETGVLLAQGVQWLSAEERNRLRHEISNNSKGFADLVSAHGLRLDGTLVVEAGRWITPAFSPRRFDTWFFAAWLPEGQEPDVQLGELEFGEWIRPADALDRWRRGKVLMVPPTIHALEVLAKGAHDLTARLTALPQARREPIQRIEVKPGIVLFPLRTATLPPATHTNCYIVGGREIVVIDPASPFGEETEALDDFLDEMTTEGRKIRKIILTHHHKDHVGGVMHLKERLGVPVAAHRLTAESLKDKVTVDRFIEDNDIIELPGEPGWRLQALHTPGHARGHLCFFEENLHALITGDNVVGIGTVLIDPPEGNMIDYLNSLKRLRELPASVIFGAHGPPVGGPKHKIDQYIKHRLARESCIVEAIVKGSTTPPEIVKAVYTDVPESVHGLAERSVIAHLEKLIHENRVMHSDGRYALF
ncbi:MAG TPA: MBL fold metallo-hydrolase [Blastocatellia bacterium]|nr:MBL fold metallo-hydrolase [Blastocatellia bacterium]